MWVIVPPVISTDFSQAANCMAIGNYVANSSTTYIIHEVFFSSTTITTGASIIIGYIDGTNASMASLTITSYTFA